MKNLFIAGLLSLSMLMGFLACSGDVSASPLGCVTHYMKDRWGIPEAANGWIYLILWQEKHYTEGVKFDAGFVSAGLWGYKIEQIQGDAIHHHILFWTLAQQIASCGCTEGGIAEMPDHLKLTGLCSTVG